MSCVRFSTICVYSLKGVMLVRVVSDISTPMCPSRISIVGSVGTSVALAEGRTKVSSEQTSSTARPAEGTLQWHQKSNSKIFSI